MEREQLGVREVGYFRILPKTARPENPWQNRGAGYFNTFLIPRSPVTESGLLLTVLLLCPKVLFLQVEKLLEHQCLRSNSNILFQSL